MADPTRRAALLAPEPCLGEQCRSPVACGGWGYCRERNARDDRARAAMEEGGA